MEDSLCRRNTRALERERARWVRRLRFRRHFSECAVRSPPSPWFGGTERSQIWRRRVRVWRKSIWGSRRCRFGDESCKKGIQFLRLGLGLIFFFFVFCEERESECKEEGLSLLGSFSGRRWRCTQTVLHRSNEHRLIVRTLVSNGVMGMDWLEQLALFSS